MKENLYKFENYPDQDFPVYLSVQQGRKHLTHLHFHDDLEMMQVLSGKVTLRAGNERTVCSAGDIAYIPPLALHEITAETEDAAIRGLVFDLSLIQLNSLRTDYPALFRESTFYRFSGNSEYHAELTESLERIAKAYPEQTDAAKLEISSSLFRLFSVFLRAGIVQKDWHSSTNYIRIRPVTEYIEQNFHRKITISELSGLLNVCDDHCIRLFKTALSKTPSEYIIDVRLRHAMKLLSEREETVQMISEKCGFTTVSYFSKMFRERLGMTPSEFRSSVLK